VAIAYRALERWGWEGHQHGKQWSTQPARSSAGLGCLRVTGYSSPIGCGHYGPGHDLHPIGMRETVDRAGTEGHLEHREGHAALRTVDGACIELWTHDLATLRQVVVASLGARLLVAEHVLWFDLVDDDGDRRLGCVNVAFVPVDDCGGREHAEVD